MERESNGSWTGPETMTSDQILRSLLDVDGVKRLDADTLDGLSSASFCVPTRMDLLVVL